MSSNKLRLEYRTPAELDDNPENWREHPEAQMKALDELLSDEEVGWAGAVLYNERTKKLVDGHARKKRAIEKGEKVIPVLIGNWSEEAEKKILLSLDPIASLARTNTGKQSALLKQLTEANRNSVQSILDNINGNAKAIVEQAKNPTKLKPVPPAPDMTWVLLGIPTVRYAEVSAQVAQLGEIKTADTHGQIVLETVANNHLPDPGA